DAYGQQLGTFLTEVSAGRAWLTTTLVAAAVTAICFAVRHVGVLAFVTLGTALGVVPIAQQGHAGATADHNIAVSSIWLHIVFAGVWVGGLLTVLLIRPLLDEKRLRVVLSRYSTVA